MQEKRHQKQVRKAVENEFMKKEISNTIESKLQNITKELNSILKDTIENLCSEDYQSLESLDKVDLKRIGKKLNEIFFTLKKVNNQRESFEEILKTERESEAIANLKISKN